MTSVFQLYGRPLAESEPLPPLMIVGSLPSYVRDNSYEGRLDIVNAIGKCTAEIVESSLPTGAYVFVDNFTHEVVLAWPAYTPPTIEEVAVPNGDFEQGDDGQWRKGAGWTIEAGGAETGTFSGVFANHRGTSFIESARVPYNGETITASARFQQGASSSGNVGGSVILVWCDANGNMLPGGAGVSFDEGNVIRSGSNGAWGTSSVTARSAVAKTVAVGFSAFRRKQNKSARVDNFVWNHGYRVGTADDIDYTVTIKVTDSANRVAYWTGTISEYIAPTAVPVTWTNRGTIPATINNTINSLTLNMTTTTTGWEGCNAYSQPIDFSGFAVGGVIELEFDRTYTGSWWDDTAGNANAGYSTLIQFRKLGADVPLDNAMWRYQYTLGGSPKDAGIEIYWRRSHTLDPVAYIIGNGGEGSGAGISMTQVNAGTAAEISATAHIKVVVTRPAADTIVVDVYINGVHRYTAQRATSSLALMVPTTGCIFAHGHNYSIPATTTMENTTYKIEST